MVQEIGMTGMLRTGIGGRFIQYFAVQYCGFFMSDAFIFRIAAAHCK